MCASCNARVLVMFIIMDDNFLKSRLESRVFIRNLVE